MVALPGVGASPDGKWSEDSLLLIDPDPVWVIDRAREFGQNAVFRWTATNWRIVGVLLHGERVAGWRCDRVPE